MNPEIVPIHRKEYLREDGMLFVRTDGIVDTMVKVPLLVASMIIVAAIMPIQSSFSSPRTLDLIIYPDGSTHVSTEIDVDPLATDYELDLFGSTIDNLVAVGENNFLLDANILGDSALIETFGSSVISVEYDIHDLVSKQGKVWTFSLDAPSDFTLLLPKNSAIVGMTSLPINMEIINDKNQLTLSGGNVEINYLFSTPVVITDSPNVTDSTSQPDYLMYAVIGGVVTAVVIGTVVITRSKQKIVKPIQEQKSTQPIQDQKLTQTETIDTESIFKLKPDIREDDKEIVKFISNNGGEALESELRKKFLQPRTTMWRAVKRLERNGIIEIEKKDLQNLVKLRKNMEEEE
ncbi:MAG: helix-turn-helix transcriptional regulator [Candidatus Nitrosopumilus sp. bin_6a]